MKHNVLLLSSLSRHKGKKKKHFNVGSSLKPLIKKKKKSYFQLYIIISLKSCSKSELLQYALPNHSNKDESTYYQVRIAAIIMDP